MITLYKHTLHITVTYNYTRPEMDHGSWFWESTISESSIASGNSRNSDTVSYPQLFRYCQLVRGWYVRLTNHNLWNSQKLYCIKTKMLVNTKAVVSMHVKTWLKCLKLPNYCKITRTRAFDLVLFKVMIMWAGRLWTYSPLQCHMTHQGLAGLSGRLQSCDKHQTPHSSSKLPQPAQKRGIDFKVKCLNHVGMYTQESSLYVHLIHGWMWCIIQMCIM